MHNLNTKLIHSYKKLFYMHVIQSTFKKIFLFFLIFFLLLHHSLFIIFIISCSIQKKIQLNGFQVINISNLQNHQSIENIHLQEQLFDQNIFQNTMKKIPCQQTNNQLSYSNQQNESPLQPSESIDQTISKVLETLDASAAIDYLNSLDQNDHLVQCYKAEIYFKLSKINEAKLSCQKAFEHESTCTKCIYLYLQIGQNTADNQNVINFLSKKFGNNKFSDSFLSTKINRAKNQSFIQNHFHQFFENLKNSGAQFSKIKIIQNEQDSRSVIANCDMKKDETIIYVPKTKLILLQTAKNSEIVKKIHLQKLYLRSPKHCQLSIFLLEQQQLGIKSDFFHYINHFPKKFSTFPVNFTEQELLFLKGSPFLQQVQQKIIDMRKDYEAICSTHQEFSRFKFQDFKRYRLIVSSRIFGISIGKHRTDALVPLADMLNHHLPKQTSWYYSDIQEGFVIKSLKSIPKGQQIYDSYGQKCNSRFFLNYGFTLQNNQANQVAIRINIQFQDSDKQQFVKQIILKVPKNVQSKQFQQMISVLRYSVNEDLLNDSDAITLESIKKTPFQDMDVQLKIWQKLQKIVQGQLNAYPTNLKEDKRLLTEKDLPINVYNCIMLRKGEKQILMFYLNMCKKLIKFFKRGCVIKGNQLKSYQQYLSKINFS